MTNTKEYRNQLAESFVHLLEEKQLDWKKEWQAPEGIMNPLNGRTGYRYHGINRFYLYLIAMERGYQDNRWCTFHQIKDKEWKLVNAKGQGVKVEYWFPYDTEERKPISWDELRRRKGTIGERYALRATYKTVFNASLIDGIPKMPEPEQKDISPDILIKKLSDNMGVPIINDGGDRSFYSPPEDKIHLPRPEYFQTDYAYDSTALHELAHSTGATHRLNRNLSGEFGTQEYAYEELVAEISSCFMSANLRIEQNEEHIKNHKAYVQSWIRSIREKPETLIRAVQQAERTASYMEYKAELIDRGEYEKTVSSSTETEQENLLPEKAEKGKSVQKKSREELNMVIQEIRKDLDEIRDDTKALSEFAEKYGIEVKDYIKDPDKEAEIKPAMAEQLVKSYENSIGRTRGK